MISTCYKISYEPGVQNLPELSPLEKALVALGDFRRKRRIEKLLEATNELEDPFTHEYEDLDAHEVYYVYTEVRRPLSDSVVKILNHASFSVKQITKKEYEEKTPLSGV